MANDTDFYAVCWKDTGRVVVSTVTAGVMLYPTLAQARIARNAFNLRNCVELRRCWLSYQGFPIAGNGRAILKPGQEWLPRGSTNAG